MFEKLYYKNDELKHLCPFLLRSTLKLQLYHDYSVLLSGGNQD